MAFPAFSKTENTFEFTVQTSLVSNSFRQLVAPAYSAIKGDKGIKHALNDYFNLFLNSRITFKVHRLTSEGAYIAPIENSRPLAVGESYIYNHNLTRADKDELILFVASRGRGDKNTSSPGNMTARYVTSTSIAGYRTGFFARPLNDQKGHYGFTGLNPALVSDEKIKSGLLLMNHSSNPDYNQSVNPTIKIYAETGETFEAAFGSISPHGYKEVILDDAFSEIAKWKKYRVNFWSSTHCKGVTLASFHTYRDTNNILIAIEHSRPSHAQVINYWKKK